MSFQIVNYAKIRLCCSSNVISQFDKCYLGNMTGMTFSSNSLPHIDVKTPLILSGIPSPLVFLQKLIRTHTPKRSLFSFTPSFIIKRAEMCFLACTFHLLTHMLLLWTILLCTAASSKSYHFKSKIQPLYIAGLIYLLQSPLSTAIQDDDWALCRLHGTGDSGGQSPYANSNI